MYDSLVFIVLLKGLAEIRGMWQKVGHLEVVHVTHLVRGEGVRRGVVLESVCDTHLDGEGGRRREGRRVELSES